MNVSNLKSNGYIVTEDYLNKINMYIVLDKATSWKTIILCIGFENVCKGYLQYLESNIFVY